MTIFIIIVLILLVLGIICFILFFKIPKLKNLTFIDGGLGTGKSALSVCFAIRKHKSQLRKWYIRNFFIFWNLSKEKPLLYSNIPLKYKYYCPLTKDLIYRKKRFNYKSVLLLDECSLLADQMDYKNAELSERLSELYKLYRHETRGGYCIANSQSISDMHYSFKYCISDYFYIHSKIRLPFFSIVKIQEYAYSSENAVQQVNNGDVEDNSKVFIFSNKYFKNYDTFCHSVYTDKLKRVYKTMNITNRKHLKSRDYLSFKELTYINDKRVISDVNCPKCGAIMKINSENDFCTCDYCGFGGFRNVLLKGVKNEKK